MRILLIHNPKAGDRNHSKKQLMSRMKKYGLQAFYQSIKERGWKQAFKKPVDLVIAAGGDGTVHKTAWEIMDSGIPLEILPLGTANNLARSLGFAGSVDEILQSLHCGSGQPFDVGVGADHRGLNIFWKRRVAGCSPTTFHSQRRTKKRRLRRRKSSTRTYRFCASCRSIIRRATGR